LLSSIIQQKDLSYPEADEYFSPSEHFPEYRLGHIASKPNQVYRAVRDCFVQAGLDAENLGTPNWNPLRYAIPEGSVVFVLCNFVYHRREHESIDTFAAKCTHGSVVRAVIDYILLAVGENGLVRFGNAPVQSCDWTRVLNETGAAQVADFYGDRVPQRVVASDLRSYIVRRNAVGVFDETSKQEKNQDEVEVDLGVDSLLEELYTGNVQPRFRILDYDPGQTERYHAKGRHVYVINKQILEADVIFSIPKLKTHEKVGATLGIKGCVGSIAHKHCLAHFRLGSPKCGGDEYDVHQTTNSIESRLGEHLNRMRNSRAKDCLRMVDFFLRKFILKAIGNNVGGGWSGNDTTWRMSMDIARILKYANRSGVLQDIESRRHILMIDGVIAGEGQGPLSPTPRRSGILVYSDDIACGDYVACKCMGIVPEMLPIIKRAFELKSFPLTDAVIDEIQPVVNGVITKSLPLASNAFKMPHGWRM